MVDMSASKHATSGSIVKKLENRDRNLVEPSAIAKREVTTRISEMI
jgi:hypothetical protein